MTWSYFLRKKSNLSEARIGLLRELKSLGFIVKYIRCDNAGENKSFEAEILKNGFNVRFEYTAPGTPQQNGQAERMFATLYGRARSMLNQAALTKEMRHKIWTEAANTAAKLESAMVKYRKEGAFTGKRVKQPTKKQQQRLIRLKEMYQQIPRIPKRG